MSFPLNCGQAAFVCIANTIASKMYVPANSCPHERGGCARAYWTASVPAKRTYTRKLRGTSFQYILPLQK